MEKSKQKSKYPQKTLVLVYPCHHVYRSVGAIVSEFEENHLKITEMRCMNVTIDFAHKHLENIGWGPDACNKDIPFVMWDCHLASEPLTAMIVEGNNCIPRIKKLISKCRHPFWVDEYLSVYTSYSLEQAQKDFGLWFSSIDSKEVRDTSNRAVHVLPNEVHGPDDQVMAFFERDPFCDVEKENLLLEKMCFFLIQPLAFENHCVGEILSAIGANCSTITGLKLVKKADYPSNKWQLVEKADCPSNKATDGDEYGVAVVVYKARPNLKVTHENPYIKRIDCNGVSEIGSYYIHQSEPGQEVLKDAAEFFESGFTIWAYPHSVALSGCMFEASLIGLASLQ
ncbi:hypothetical protein MKW94_018191 [Papaver nudicaule]|uniref:Nucleoside diphosphate kinase-like domain-containing protein n=1 Tax=Papaver nudicaule TaxID=74823 RepID=A0AA41VX28_PAPNU|nr:hypothetical protein [Papaver nudicaule]